MNKDALNYPLITDTEVGDLRTLTESVVYRAPGKDTLEIRKAISEAAREFIKRTGIWKVHLVAKTSEKHKGWFEACGSIGLGVPLRCDGVYFHSQITVDGGAPNALQPDGRLPLQSDFSESMRWSPSDVVFRQVMGGNIIFKHRRFDHFGGGHVYTVDNNAISGFADEEENTTTGRTVEISEPTVTVIFTVGMKFGSEDVPAWLLERHGETIADGAAHILATGPVLQPTRWGVAFEGVIEELIAKMASGGEFYGGNTTAISPDMEII